MEFLLYKFLPYLIGFIIVWAILDTWIKHLIKFAVNYKQGVTEEYETHKPMPRRRGN